MKYVPLEGALGLDVLNKFHRCAADLAMDGIAMGWRQDFSRKSEESEGSRDRDDIN